MVSGHFQPHVPADLGFYDLRVPETRMAQATLAARYGIDGFCYYHYWFEGRRLLERPFNEVLRSNQPDFPFCLCWANETWTRRWDGGHDDVLLQQGYSPTDDLRHIHWLMEAFTDPRYIRVQGRPLFLVYRVSSLPDPGERRTSGDKSRYGSVRATRICASCKILMLIASTPAPWVSTPPSRLHPTGENWARREGIGGSASVEKHSIEGARTERTTFTTTGCTSNRSSDLPNLGIRPTPACVRGSTTPLGGRGAVHRCCLGSTPTLYEWWVREICERLKQPEAEEDLLFVNAWNEWGEGNHLEPCQRWGRAYLEAHERATNDARQLAGPFSASSATLARS